jgi:hypothetical protein
VESNRAHGRLMDTV